MWTLIHEIIYFLSFIIPKDKKLWVFGAWQGKIYSDNSKYLYEYIRENAKEIKAVWITKNMRLAEELRNRGYNCYYYQSLKGIWMSIRAGTVFSTSGLGDISEWACTRALHIQLWHGTPLKKIGYDNIGWDKFIHASKLQKIKNKLLPYVEHDPENDLFMVSSEEAKNKTITAFRVNKNHIFVTGQPRNDAFVRKSANPFFEQLKAEHPGVKIVCYLPTHRNFGTTKNNPLTADVLMETDAYLKQHNIMMIFKPHFHELMNLAHMKDAFSNIILGLNEQLFSDVYNYLPCCDLLISDYSSVYVDFMCSGKPIVFFPYDLEDYMANDAALYYKYEEITPGPVCFTWNDTLNAVVSSLNNISANPNYSRLCNFFNTFNDGKNCERVCWLVKRKLKIL